MKSTRVLVVGPLAPYAAGYRAELDAHGYSPWTAVSYLYSFARLSRWLAAQGLAVGDLDGVCVDRFVADRPGGRVGAVRRATPRGTSSLLGYLQRAGAAPAPAVIGTDVGGREALVNEFACFLRTERGLAETTIDWYRHVAAMFLSAQVGDVTDMAVLSVRQVNAFVLAQIGRRGTGSLNNVVTALRALLRFFYLRGYTATPLAGAAPRTVGWRDRGPSRGLAAEQVARLLAGCDRRTSSGRRDFAILTVLARLGCARMRSRRCGSRTWTGAPVRSPCTARETEPIGCRCRWMSGRRSPITVAAAGPGSRAGHCSRRHAPRMPG